MAISNALAKMISLLIQGATQDSVLERIRESTTELDYIGAERMIHSDGGPPRAVYTKKGGYQQELQRSRHLNWNPEGKAKRGSKGG